MRIRSSIIILVLSCMAFLGSSCNNTEFSNPAFQGDRNNQLWLATSFSASFNDEGLLVITATNNIETVNLIVPSDDEGTYLVGNGNAAVAEYIDGFDTLFTTDVIPDESETIYPEIGQITISEKNSANNSYSGEFRFIAFDSEGLNPVGYSNGKFLNITLRSN